MNKLLIPTDLVSSDQNGNFTTSLKVAEHFHKQHKNALRDIEKILADCPNEEFRRLNFEPTFYDVPGPNNSIRKEKMYRLTEEGFAILAMGFTGSKALEWKIDFLESFRLLKQFHEQRVNNELQGFRYLSPNLSVVQKLVRLGYSNKQVLERSPSRSLSSVTRAKRKLRNAGLLA